MQLTRSFPQRSLLSLAFPSCLLKLIMISITAVVLCFIASLIFLIIKGKKRVPPLPPGPTPWPIVGCLPEMWRNRRPAYKWIHDLMDQFNTDILCLRLGYVHTIVVKSPELAREFLKKHDAVFASRPTAITSHLASDGYLTTAFVPMGDQWKKMKRVLLIVFNQPRFQWLHKKRNDEADNLVKFLYNQCSKSENGSIVNVRNVAQHHIANTMRVMLFNTRYFRKGREDGGPGVEEEKHVSAIFTILFNVFGFCVSNYFPWLSHFGIDGHEKKLRDASKTMKLYQDPIIDERVRKWRCIGLENKEHIQEDLLDVLILLKDDNGKPLLSPQEIKAQITEIQVAAVDNPSSIAEWGLSEMLNQPEMLTKAQEELDRVVGVNTLVQESHLPHLRYITACVKESLRLHPVAPFNVPHVSVDDATIAGYFIPKGSCVLLSRIGLGRNPKVWENPMKFDPERHLSGDSSERVDLLERELRFISFSIGRRGCVGSSLGSSMSLMLFARLLQGFKWSMPSGVDKIDLIEAPKTFLKLKPLIAVAKPRLNANIYPI